MNAPDDRRRAGGDHHRRFVVPGRPSAWAGRALAAVVAAIGRIRPGRPLHPEGLWLTGALVLRPGGDSGIGWIDEGGREHVRVRLSRGIGLPSACPDILGLAMRCPLPDRRTADVLLATTGRGPLSRCLLIPRRDLRRAFFSSMMPWRGVHGPVQIAAVGVPRPEPLPVRRAVLDARLAAAPWQVELLWARPNGRWQAFGAVTLTPDPDGDDRVRFDPVRHVPAGARTYDWAARLRERAYARARRSPDGSARAS